MHSHPNCFIIIICKLFWVMASTKSPRCVHCACSKTIIDFYVSILLCILCSSPTKMHIAVHFNEWVILVLFCFSPFYTDFESMYSTRWMNYIHYHFSLWINHRVYIKLRAHSNIAMQTFISVLWIESIQCWNK